MHDRNSDGDLMRILSEFRNLPPVVIHCFTATRGEAETFARAGYYIGVTGFLVLRQRGRALRGFLASVVPLDKLLLETDCPYMGFGEDDWRCADFGTSIPGTNRKSPNEPCTLPILAETVAELYGVSSEVVAMMTTMNAQRFYNRSFGLPMTPEALREHARVASLSANSRCRSGAGAPISEASGLSRAEGSAVSTASRGKGQGYCKEQVATLPTADDFPALGSPAPKGKPKGGRR